MLCEKCKKNIATMHIKSVVNGVVSEKHLCSNCYDDTSFNDETSLDDMLLSLMNNHFTPSIKSVNRCPVCNSTLNDISNSGKVGCPKCYEVFKESLIPFIKRIQGNINHIGKTPNNNLNMTPDNSNEIDKLKEKLKSLIAEEKFEEAAVIRDRIKELEGSEK